MIKEGRKIYLDYAATTPLDPQVLEVMRYCLEKYFGNTMSLHSFGQEAKTLLEECREKVADLMGAKQNEVIFTSSATESNNLALKGIALANRNRGRHIIISSIEHPCVLESAKFLEKEGFEIEMLKVNKYGLVDPVDVERSIRKDTILVSVMHANNEIGTIQPIKEIGKICRDKNVYFHTDAAQTFGKIPLNVKDMKIDLMTVSSHKIYGPKGVGALFIREGVKIEPLLHGGGQEMGLRSSTVNVPAIVGFSKACEIAKENMLTESKRLKELSEKLIKGVLENVPESYLNGDFYKRLPNIINFWFKGVNGEDLAIKLDLMGIAVSTGAACSTQKLKENHVLLAIGLNEEEAQSALRISLGRWTTKDDIDYFLSVLPNIIKKLRKIS